VVGHAGAVFGDGGGAQQCPERQAPYDLGITNRSSCSTGWGPHSRWSCSGSAACAPCGAGSLTGVTITMIVLVLVSRFSLPLLEGYAPTRPSVLRSGS